MPQMLLRFESTLTNPTANTAALPTTTTITVTAAATANATATASTIFYSCHKDVPREEQIAVLIVARYADSCL